MPKNMSINVESMMNVGPLHESTRKYFDEKIASHQTLVRARNFYGKDFQYPNESQRMDQNNSHLIP